MNQQEFDQIINNYDLMAYLWLSTFHDVCLVRRPLPEFSKVLVPQGIEGFESYKLWGRIKYGYFRLKEDTHAKQIADMLTEPSAVKQTPEPVEGLVKRLGLEKKILIVPERTDNNTQYCIYQVD